MHDQPTHHFYPLGVIERPGPIRWSNDKTRPSHAVGQSDEKPVLEFVGSHPARIKLLVAIRNHDFQTCPHHAKRACLDGSERVIKLVVVPLVALERVGWKRCPLDGPPCTAARQQRAGTSAE